MYVAPLLRKVTHNLPGLKTTVEEQVGQPLLALVGKHGLDNLPYLTAGSYIFNIWLPQFSWLW